MDFARAKMWMLLSDLIGGPAMPQVISDDHGDTDPRQPLEANAIRMRFEMGVTVAVSTSLVQESEVLVNWLETGPEPSGSWSRTARRDVAQVDSGFGRPIRIPSCRRYL